MLVDCHTHLSRLEHWGDAFIAGRAKIRGANLDLDLDVTYERHWEGVARADRVIAFGINSRALGMHTPNAYIAQYAAMHPDKIVGFMSIDPQEPDALDELEHGVHDLKLRGIKMSPVYQGFHPSDPRAQEIYRRAQKYGLPIVCHQATQFQARAPLKYADPILFDEVATLFPDLVIVLAHIGHPWYAETAVTIRKHPNLYADISGSCTKPWWFYNALVTCYEYGVADKLLFGSDFPLWSIEETIHALRNVNAVAEGTHLPRVPEDVIESIIVRDALRLLGLE